MGLLGVGAVALRISPPAPIPVRTQMIRAGQEIVRDTLNEGIHAAFGTEDETSVEPMADGKTMISGWVDLYTDSGRHDRQNYSVVVYNDPALGWVGERATVIPQL
jgi:hypothetical protein